MGAMQASLNLKRLYYTSRGFALLDVNYRGSTGYGRQYRELLKNKYVKSFFNFCVIIITHLLFVSSDYYSWGIFDIEDGYNGALFLAKQGRVAGNKLCITDGSAGGFTVLACLTLTDVFQAGNYTLYICLCHCISLSRMFA